MSNTPVSKMTEKPTGTPAQNAPTTKALLTASFRFFLAISCSLGLSYLFHDTKLGGFAALACFMALLSDTKDSLKSRLSGLLLVYCGLMAAAGIGYVLKSYAYGQWIVIGLCCFGASLMTFTEMFAWLVCKYCLVFLMVSLFDFSPDRVAFIGYSMGFGIAAVVIVADHFLWNADHLGLRPMDELKRFIGGERNPKSFAVVSALILVFSLWSAEKLGLKEPAWVGITVVYLMNTKLAFAVKRSLLRIIGTFLGYLAVVLLYPIESNLVILALCIIASGMMIPLSMPKNYGYASFFITVFILLMLDWLLHAYGGDARLLLWRLVDTAYGVVCTIIGLILLQIIRLFDIDYDGSEN